MIDRVAGVLREVTHELVLVANDPEAEGWLSGARVVPDLTPGAGPLAGVQSGLDAAAGRDVLVVAWDMPFVSAALLKAIVASGDGGGAIVVPESAPGRAEPACAFYPAACRAALDAFLARGERKPSRFLEEYGIVERLGPDDLARFGDSVRLLMSVNTRAELEQASRPRSR
jgi:molybdopterin-guanine dinucleotide biosynthesis protein A